MIKKATDGLWEVIAPSGQVAGACASRRQALNTEKTLTVMRYSALNRDSAPQTNEDYFWGDFSGKLCRGGCGRTMFTKRKRAVGEVLHARLGYCKGCNYRIEHDIPLPSEPAYKCRCCKRVVPTGFHEPKGEPQASYGGKCAKCNGLTTYVKNHGVKPAPAEPPKPRLEAAPGLASYLARRRQRQQRAGAQAGRSAA